MDADRAGSGLQSVDENSLVWRCAVCGRMHIFLEPTPKPTTCVGCAGENLAPVGPASANPRATYSTGASILGERRRVPRPPRLPARYGELVERGAEPIGPSSYEPKDLTRVNASEPADVEYWTRRFGCTDAELRRSIIMVGVNASELEAYIRRHKRVF